MSKSTATNKVAKLEVQLEKKLSRRKREYTEEERKAIRASLLAGQEEALKRQENEHTVKPEKIKKDTNDQRAVPFCNKD